VTVCRFLPAAARGRPVVVVEDEEATADEEFMADLHSRLVATGLVSYTERHVGDGAEMVTALGSVAGTYSLVVLGRSSSGAGAEAMTRDLGDWGQEVPELGPVGELLASDDLRAVPPCWCCSSTSCTRPRPGSRCRSNLLSSQHQHAHADRTDA
jgi:hypothetical protein